MPTILLLKPNAWGVEVPGQLQGTNEFLLIFNIQDLGVAEIVPRLSSTFAYLIHIGSHQ